MAKKKWKDVRRKLSPEAEERIRAETQAVLLEMNLAELRRNVSGLTQTEVADLLGRTQASISELERREDMLLSKLAGYLRALGGELEVRVTFKGQEPVRITQFDGVREQILEQITAGR